MLGYTDTSVIAFLVCTPYSYLGSSTALSWVCMCGAGIHLVVSEAHTGLLRPAVGIVRYEDSPCRNAFPSISCLD